MLRLIRVEGQLIRLALTICLAPPSLAAAVEHLDSSATPSVLGGIHGMSAMSDAQSAAEKVAGWLKKTGLPLELQTFAALKAAGFEAEHSSVYVDPEFDKGREVDVVAHARDPLGLLYVFVVAECKASPNPWVVVVNDRDPKVGAFSSIGVVEERAEKLLPDSFWYRGDVATRLKRSFGGGYALRQAFSNESDPAYAASMSVLKAAVAVINSYTVSKPRFLFAMPVIVVESPILECFLDEAGELSLKEVEISEFLFTAHIPSRTRAVIRIVRGRALPKFSRWVASLANEVKSQLKDSTDSLLNSIRQGEGT